MEKDLSLQAAQIARQRTLKALKRYKVTEGRVAKRLGEALDAMETKVFHDKQTGACVYSKPLIAHGSRLKAIELATVLLDMKPAEKHDVSVNGIESVLEGIYAKRNGKS